MLTSRFDIATSSQIDQFLWETVGPRGQHRYNVGSECDPDEREKIRATIKMEIEKRIAGPPSELEQWIAEMRQHNHSALSDGEFITKILTDYRCDRPFVLHRDCLEELAKVHVDQLKPGGRKVPDTSFHRSDCSHKSLEKLCARENSSGPCFWSDNDELERVRREVDAVLGLAGVRPRLKTPFAANFDEISLDSLRQDCLKELNDRIKIRYIVYSILEGELDYILLK
jgi:hypothetical protein